MKAQFAACARDHLKQLKTEGVSKGRGRGAINLPLCLGIGHLKERIDGGEENTW